MSEIIVFKDANGSQKYPMTVMSAVSGLSAELAKITSFDVIYPIGSIYLSMDSTSPAILFGGTWTELSAGKTFWITSTSSNDAGDTISAGLPNITGNLPDRIPYEGSWDGCFAGSWYTKKGAAGGSAWNNGHIYFSASNSNSIYGNSSTVQPPAIKVYAWKRVPDNA